MLINRKSVHLNGLNISNTHLRLLRSKNGLMLQKLLLLMLTTLSIGRLLPLPLLPKLLMPRKTLLLKLTLIQLKNNKMPPSKLSKPLPRLLTMPFLQLRPPWKLTNAQLPPRKTTLLAKHLLPSWLLKRPMPKLPMMPSPLNKKPWNLASQSEPSSVSLLVSWSLEEELPGTATTKRRRKVLSRPSSPLMTTTNLSPIARCDYKYR